MSKMNVENGKFKLPITVSASGNTTKTLQTKDTYLDKDINVVVSVPEAQYSTATGGEVTATAGLQSASISKYTTTSKTPYTLTVTANAHVNSATVGVETAGFVSTSDTVTLAAADATQNTKTVYLKEGALSGTGEAGILINRERLNLDLLAGTESDYDLKASGSGSVSVQTAGWIDPSNSPSVSTSGDKYYILPGASIANVAQTDTEYEELEAPVLTENGYLYINGGYFKKNSKISLATLVPDNANITSENANLVYNTVKAYDKDGKLIVGTMGNGAVSASNTLTVTNGSATVQTTFKDSDNNDISVGILTTQPTEGRYITISTTTSAQQKGQITGDIKANVTSAGYITTAGSKTASVTKDVMCNIPAAEARYIKIYDGAFL